MLKQNLQRTNKRLLFALALFAMVPLAGPMQNAFAAVSDGIEAEAIQTENAATSSNAKEETQKAIEKDGFFATYETGLCYRKNGKVLENEWFQINDAWYYAGENGRLATNWKKIDDIWYYFNSSRTLHTGWLNDGGSWYYLTENGMATEYQVIGEKECYFYEDGHLAIDEKTPDGRMADTDGYLYSPELEFGSFQYTKDTTGAPGTLSGLVIAGKPAEFYMLSIAGETSGGQLVMGDNGRAYGLCQLDYRHDLIDFIRWAYDRHPKLWTELEPFLSYQTGDEALVGSTELECAFLAAMERSYEGAVTDQLEYMRTRYWDGCYKKLNAAGFQLDERHIAVSAALFSVNVNCGNQTAIYLESLSPEMTDAEMICKIYELRNTTFAEQMVGRHKKETTGRYEESEPEMALDLLYGYTTIDSRKYYGHGVSWNGNIFSDSVLTKSIAGKSEDWTEYKKKKEEDIAEEKTELATESDAEKIAEEETVVAEAVAETKTDEEEVGPGYEL